ncbi:nuclear pore complex protein NUP160 isoform X2 [Tanacetum coccineum]
MTSGSYFDGKEVPIISNDAVMWLNVGVPSTSIIQPSPDFHTPPINDASSMCIIRNHDESPIYFIWRINKKRPNILELVQFGSFAEFPRVGLRIQFASALCPFASLCKNQSESASVMPYMLYTLSVEGVAYLIRLNNLTNYGWCSFFPTTDVVELNMRSYGDGSITAIAATTGFLVIGKEDGSLSCFRLGSLDSTSPGMAIKENSTNDPATAVKELVCLEIRGRTHLLVLHSNGDLQVWDLLSSTRFYDGLLERAIPEGKSPIIFLNVDGEIISIYALYFCPQRCNDCRSERSELRISVEEGGVIDVKLSPDKIWILKKDTLIPYNLSGPCKIRSDIIISEHEQCFGLQELVVAEQLFQSSEHDADNLFRLAHSLYPSAKEQIATHVSSVFMCRLYLPGIFHSSVLRATLRDLNKHFTNSEFHSLSADGIRKEIMSLIEQQGASRSPHSLLYRWKNFYSRYMYHWCHENAPCALLLDSSTGAIGLIRKSSISLMRSLEDIELLSLGSFNGFGEMASRSITQEMLFEVLRCTRVLSQQLGNGAADFIYESFFSEPSPEDIVGRLVKVLETGYTSSGRGLHVSDLSVDSAWEDKRRDHNTHRRFSMKTLLSLCGLCQKAKTWGNIITVIKLYLDFLVAQKIDHNSDSEAGFDVRTCITVQVTSQVAKVTFDSAVDILLLLKYMVKLGGQINMHPDDVSRIQIELFPLLQKIITEWHIIYFLGTTPCESRAIEDSSSQLSLLRINSSSNRRSWNEKLGKFDFTLAFLLILDRQKSFQGQNGVNLGHLPSSSSFNAPLRNFSSWIVWGTSEEGPSSFTTRSTMLALILLKHGQFDAVEHLLGTVNHNLLKEKFSHGIQGVNNEWCTILHLLGCCFVAQANREASQTSTQKKVEEAISCFFRVAALHGASRSLQNLSNESGLPHLAISDHVSPGAWKLHYYQRAMTIFEQYNISAGACQFALAALEQIDVVLGLDNIYSRADFLNEDPNLIKGRLWASVFKFYLDLKNYHGAYCAMISNPDEESKYSCLRRFINVLFEHRAVKILRDGSFPFVGLVEKVEQELALKAKCSDVTVTPHPLKVLYAFASHRGNWRKAASYMYLYSTRLKSETAERDPEFRLFALQERLNCLSATINALHLTNCAWINISHPDANDDTSTQKPDSCMDIEKLENEFLLTSAEHFLSKEKIEWTFTGIERPPPNLIDLLVQSNLYDMVFTVILKFYSGSALKRELERVLTAMSQKCCPSRNDTGKHGLLLPSKDKVASAAQHSKRKDQWDALKKYIEKYKPFHPRLPVIVAETLLCADNLIQLPLWLVEMVKTTQDTSGMAGSESSPASLFQLYVDYGRYAEATNLLLHYIEAFTSLGPAGTIHMEETFALWFPYTTIERLWFILGELIKSGHKVAQCEEQKSVLKAALRKYFRQLNLDPDAVLSFATS